MPRITTPLTNTQIEKAKPTTKVFNLFDGGGLQLRVKPNGSKLWILDYARPYTKKRTSISLGAYPALTLANARIKRDEAKALLAQNIDPKEYRENLALQNNSALSNTLKHVAEQWLEIKKTKVSADHAQDTWRSLELHIFPTLGDVPITKITAVKAIETIKPIAAKGSLETVKRLCQRLNEIMVFAVNSGLIDSNSLAGIASAFQAPSKKHQPTLKPEELPNLMSALSVASIKLTTRCLIEWQLHTMVRPSEAAGTRWEEIDFEEKYWVIPAERMKRKRPHTVPLTPQTLQLLTVMQSISGKSEFVFASDRSLHKPCSPQTANMALKRMGFGGRLVAHGLRSLASTTLNEQGFDEDIIEAALSHTSKNQVRSAYNRAEYIQRRISLMDWWSNHIDQAAMGNLGLTGKRALRSVTL